MKRQKKMEIAFESFWKNNNKLNNILNGVNNGIMDKISIGEFAQLCFKEGFNAGCWSCDDRWIDCEKSNPKKTGKYLVYMFNKSHPDCSMITEAIYTSTECCEKWEYVISDYKIIRWQPFPAVPKEFKNA